MKLTLFTKSMMKNFMLWQEMTNNFSLQQQNSNSHNICFKTFYGRYNSPFLFNNFCDFNLFKFSFPVLFIVDFFFFKIFHCLDTLKMSQPVTFYEITSIWKTTHPDYFFQEFSRSFSRRQITLQEFPGVVATLKGGSIILKTWINQIKGN